MRAGEATGVTEPCDQLCLFQGGAAPATSPGTRANPTHHPGPAGHPGRRASPTLRQAGAVLAGATCENHLDGVHHFPGSAAAFPLPSLANGFMKFTSCPSPR